MSSWNEIDIVDRFSISILPIDSRMLFKQWELYAEAHNGFDNYLAYELIHEMIKNKTLQAQIEKLTKCSMMMNEQDCIEGNDIITCQGCKNKKLIEEME